MGQSRGLPGRAGLVTQGYGGEIFALIAEPARQLIAHGKSSVKILSDQINIYVKMIKINGSNHDVPKIEGRLSISLDMIKNSQVKLVEIIKRIVKKIKITVTRI